MTPLSLKHELVERIRYHALLGILDCAEEVVETLEQADLNFRIVRDNLYVLERLDALFPLGVELNDTLPEEDERPYECDESAKQTDDYGAEWPWIFFCKG